MEERESSESRINVILKEERPEVLKEGKKKKGFLSRAQKEEHEGCQGELTRYSRVIMWESGAFLILQKYK